MHGIVDQCAPQAAASTTDQPVASSVGREFGEDTNRGALAQCRACGHLKPTAEVDALGKRTPPAGGLCACNRPPRERRKGAGGGLGPLVGCHHEKPERLAPILLPVRAECSERGEPQRGLRAAASRRIEKEPDAVIGQ
jgi:hypothetical protein